MAVLNMTDISNIRPIEVLLVEDNPADIRITQEALKQDKLNINLHVAMDGEAGMRFLHKEKEFNGMPTPDLVLLDLNLPLKDGREVLKDMKSDPDLAKIPVAILTISKSEEDIIRSYNLHANCYIVKPIDLSRFIDIVKSIESFWFTVVTLPPHNNALKK